MKPRLAVPGLAALFLLASIATAGGAAAAPTEPSACFGAFASTFAQTIPASGRLVADMANDAPGVIGQTASQKSVPPCI
jgi:hypothetical protein